MLKYLIATGVGVVIGVIGTAAATDCAVQHNLLTIKEYPIIKQRFLTLNKDRKREKSFA